MHVFIGLVIDQPVKQGAATHWFIFCADTSLAQSDLFLVSTLLHAAALFNIRRRYKKKYILRLIRYISTYMWCDSAVREKNKNKWQSVLSLQVVVEWQMENEDTMANDSLWSSGSPSRLSEYAGGSMTAYLPGPVSAAEENHVWGPSPSYSFV